MKEKLFKTYTINLVILILLRKFGKLEYREIKEALALTLERKVSKGSISGTLNRLCDESLVSTKVGKINTKIGEEPVVFYEITPQGINSVDKSISYHEKVKTNIDDLNSDLKGFANPV